MQKRGNMVFLDISQYIQMFFSLFIVVLILIQGKDGGLSSSVGNSISMYRSRRGIEKTVFYLTIVSALILISNSLLIIYLS